MCQIIARNNEEYLRVLVKDPDRLRTGCNKSIEEKHSVPVQILKLIGIGNSIHQNFIYLP
jgi:hypothetical protein